MGYFSELDLTGKTEYTDRSYHGFEDQLLCRYEDLRDRYRELLNSGAPASGDDYFSREDYRYTPIEYLTTLEDVYLAMEIAREDLETKCDITVSEDGIISKTEGDEDDPDQLSIFEIVLLPIWLQTAAAA